MHVDRMLREEGPFSVGTLQAVLKGHDCPIQRPYLLHVQILFWRRISYFPLTISVMLVSAAPECIVSINLFISQ